jgi:dihydropteroate synthase
MQIRDRVFHWGRQTYLMGILNVTPDSFSDGGEFDAPMLARDRARDLVDAGADILDIGGQSTRPGAAEISVETELDRVLPVLNQVRSRLSVPISIDTTRSPVAEAAVAAGADLINDVSGGLADPQMLSVVAKLGIPIVLMHMRGTPQTMQQLTDYDDLIGEIYQFLEQRRDAAVAAGIAGDRIILDPGIGFAKTHDQNLALLQQLPVFRSLGCPLLVGVSRKSFIGRILGRSDPKDRIWGTAAACAAAIVGSADILRVHDVRPMFDVCRVSDRIFRNAQT